MKALVLPIALQLIGAVIIIVEIIVPSGGLLGMLALGVIGYSLYTVYTGVSLSAGYILTGIDLALLPVVIFVGLKLLVRSPVTLRTELASSAGVTSQPVELEQHLGQEGVALTDLRPSGLARLSGQRLDVVSRGEYIEKESAVVVVAVTGNQVIVQEL